MNGEQITDIRFDDDTVLLAETETEAQNMINQVNKTCKKYGMSHNKKKTKVMVVSKKKITPSLNIKVEGDVLDQVREYKYLGTWVNQKAESTNEVKRRIEIARAEFWRCKEFMRSNINLTLKLRLIKICVFSIVAYGSETWTFNKFTKNRIRAFELWCYRGIFRISWRDHISNEKVLDLVGLMNRFCLAC